MAKSMISPRKNTALGIAALFLSTGMAGAETWNSGLTNQLAPSGTTGLVTRVGIGANSAATDSWLYINGAGSATTGISGTSQNGIFSSPIFQSSATSTGRAGYYQLRTAAATFTMGTGVGLSIASASLGAGTTVTNLIGLDIANQTGGGTSYAIRTGTGRVGLGDNIWMTGTDGSILTNTSDATDNKRLLLSGASAANPTRAAHLVLYGNEFASIPGDAQIIAGLGGAVRLKYGSSSTDGLVLSSTGAVSIGGSLTLSQRATVTGGATVNANGSGTSSAILASGTSPTFTFVETASGTDAKTWDLQANPGSFQFRTRTDAHGTGQTWMTATRSGTTVSDVTFTPQVTASNLAGSGTRLVTASATGVLGTTPMTSIGLANPTATVGLTAIPGTATTAMRSDAAPALNVGISPTWTGDHTFNGYINSVGGINLQGGSTGQGRIWKDAAEGVAIRGVNGTNAAVSIFTTNNETLFSNAAGSRNLSLGNGSGTTTFPGPVTMTQTLNMSGANAVISSNTTDGADNKSVTLAAGGADGSSRGAGISLYGNEYAGATGNMDLVIGNVTGSLLRFSAGGAIRGTLSKDGDWSFLSPVSFSSSLNTSSLGVTGTVGIGGAADPKYGLMISNTGLTSADQFGIVNFPRFTSASVNSGTGIYTQEHTAAAPYTMNRAIGIQIDNPAKGANSNITTSYGLKIENQNQAGTNYAIYTGTGRVSLGDALEFQNGVPSLPNSDVMPLIYGTSEAASGPNPFNLNGHLVLQARAGVANTARDIIFYSGTVPAIRYRLNPSGQHQFTSDVMISGGANSDFYYGNNFRMTDYRTISLSLGTEAWVKLATISNNSNIEFQFRNGSNNSEEVAELKIFGTYHTNKTGVELTRQTYNRHLKEVRVTGVDGGSKVVYVLVRTTSFAPQINWAATVKRGSISTIHNIEETPTGGLSLAVDNSSNTVREVVGNLDYSLNNLSLTGDRLEFSNSSNNGIINTKNSFRLNIDSDNNQTAESFIVGNNQSSIDQNNVLFKVQEDGQVGIGTSSPQATLDVNGTAKISNLLISNAAFSNAPYIASKAMISPNYATDYALKQLNSGSTMLNAKAGTAVTVGVGDVAAMTVTPTQVTFASPVTVTGELSVGTIKTTTWKVEPPDYVFEKDYKLKSLKDVDSFVAKNKHLPDVPSAKEMKKNGMDLAEMNFTLLRKVEELTLHAIRQEKEIQKLASELRTMQQKR